MQKRQERYQNRFEIYINILRYSAPVVELRFDVSTDQHLSAVRRTTLSLSGRCRDYGEMECT